MTFIQKFVIALLPKRWSADIQAESESWLLQCPTCGTERSVWEVGGVRYKAKSVGKRARVWCPTCNQPRLMSVEQKPRP